MKPISLFELPRITYYAETGDQRICFAVSLRGYMRGSSLPGARIALCWTNFLVGRGTLEVRARSIAYQVVRFWLFI
jgi:hypothetical protein